MNSDPPIVADSARIQTLTHALELNGVAREFESIEDFERALEECMGNPEPDRGLVQDPLSILEESAAHIHRLEHRLIDDPNNIEEMLEELGPEYFAQAGGWRNLFAQLAALAGEMALFKCTALSTYRRFLVAAREGYLTGELTVVTGDIRPLEFPEPPHPITTEDRDRVPVSLPRRSRASIMMDDEAPATVWLAERRFRLEASEPAALVDDTGRRYPLREGQNMVGRAPYNDVVIDPSYVQVSRSHLIIDIRNGVPVAITDLSSRGTFVRRGLIV